MEKQTMEFFNMTTCIAFAGILITFFRAYCSECSPLSSSFLSIRSDMKSFEYKFETKVDSWKEEINKEMRDFHGRLCAIGEKNRRR